MCMLAAPSGGLLTLAPALKSSSYFLLRQHAPEDEAASDVHLKRTPQNRETLSPALIPPTCYTCP